MGSITKSVDVGVDVRSAYNQWTQFETFPEFMEGVERVRQFDDTHLHWVVKIGPVEREFDATVTDQTPDQRVAWKSDAGPEHAGVVTFQPLGAAQTKVTVEMTIDPDGFLESAANKTGLLDARVEGDLERFKEYIEHGGGDQTGTWRGHVN